MMKLKQLFKKLEPYIPDPKQVLKMIMVIGLVCGLSYMIGVWFGLGLNQTFSPVIINVEAVN